MQQSKCSIMIERDCTTLVNPITGDAKAFLLDRCVSCRARAALNCCVNVTAALRSYNSFDPDSESCARNDQVFEDMGPAIASSIKNEQNVRCFAAAFFTSCAAADLMQMSDARSRRSPFL